MKTEDNALLAGKLNAMARARMEGCAVRRDLMLARVPALTGLTSK